MHRGGSSLRDEHLDRYHQEERPNQSTQLQQPDPDDIQPLLFDLVQADDVEAVRSLLPLWKDSSKEAALVELAASSGSVAMLHLLLTPDLIDNLTSFARRAASHRNAEALEYILKYSCQYSLGETPCLYSMEAVLGSDSLEIYHIWKKYMARELESEEGCKSYGKSYSLKDSLLRLATGRPEGNTS
ncbi:hypothetical protein V8F06_014511 [Rhypophila decipiens]